MEMILFLIISVLFLGGFILLLMARNTNDIRDNWPKYRCSPDVIPFAAFYGHDMVENFNFCLKTIFQGHADSALSPFVGILGSFASTIAVFVGSLNSMRLQLATLVGGVTHITQEFQDRITQLMLRINITGKRMKMLMGRLFATFYAMIFMGMSGIVAVTNLGDTTLFKFLDTFCFPPETSILLEGDTAVPIASVKIGDRLLDKRTGVSQRVTGVFKFAADGQPMVTLIGGGVHSSDDLVVSTNHYVQNGLMWVQARKHPDARPAPDWKGGNDRPLICLATESRQFSIGDYTFLDYDEMEDADGETMRWVEQSLNNGPPTPSHSIYPILEYSPSVSETTPICMRNKVTCPARDIRLGYITSTGFVKGVIKKEVHFVCDIATGESVCEGTLIWDPEASLWTRAGRIFPRRKLATPAVYYSFIISGTGQLQMGSGHRIRDYMEIQSPDSEQFYTKKIKEEKGTSVVADK